MGISRAVRSVMSEGADEILYIYSLNQGRKWEGDAPLVSNCCASFGGNDVKVKNYKPAEGIPDDGNLRNDLLGP